MPEKMAIVLVSAVLLCFPSRTGSAQGDLTRYVRFTYEGKQAYGILEGQTIHELVGDLLDSPRFSERKLELSSVRLMAPCQPSQIVSVGFIHRIEKTGAPSLQPRRPFEILDSPLFAPGDPLEIPDPSSRLHSEGRLAIIIGKKAERIRAADAPGYIFGITGGCFVTSIIFDTPSLSWLPRSIYVSLGPTIVKGLDYENITIQTHLNGELRYSEKSTDLLFDPPTALSYLSQHITLLPGDVILTGTPRKPEVLQPGTVIEVEINGVGILRNTVISKNSPP